MQKAHRISRVKRCTFELLNENEAGEIRKAFNRVGTINK
jgi:hypothetical protein